MTISCIYNRLYKRSATKAKRGIAAVEFAMVAPAFFFLLIGVTEMSLMLLVQHVIESATYNGSRTAKTGYVAEGKTQLETVMDVVNSKLGSLAPLVDVQNIQVTSKNYGNLSQIDQPDQGTEGLGVAEQIVVHTISYRWHPFTPMISRIIGDSNGVVRLSSRIVVRNEPYN